MHAHTLEKTTQTSARTNPTSSSQSAGAILVGLVLVRRLVLEVDQRLVGHVGDARRAVVALLCEGEVWWKDQGYLMGPFRLDGGLGFVKRL